MQATQVIWLNGKLIPWQEANIHLLTHSLHYGSAAFEGIRFYKTRKGSAIFRLAPHVDRFLYSTNALKMTLPYSRQDIYKAILEVASLSQLEEGYLRPIAFYGYGKMGVNPSQCPVEVAIACWPWGRYLPHDSVDIKTSRLIRMHQDSTVIDAKLTGHYINGVLASLELRGTHYHEALFLDSKGFISEGVGENFFMIKDGKIYTPKLGTILAGITRDTILKIAAKLGYALIECDITLEEAYAADEAFFTGTAAEVTPIRSIDDQYLSQGPIGPITAEFKQAYARTVRGEEQDFLEYLTYFNEESTNERLVKCI